MLNPHWYWQIRAAGAMFHRLRSFLWRPRSQRSLLHDTKLVLVANTLVSEKHYTHSYAVILPQFLENIYIHEVQKGG